MRRFRQRPRSNALQNSAGTARRGVSTLRVIGGEWRSRRIRFEAPPGLRPTPDRVRETLFNWLAPVIGGSRCLDLYAGSGALGIEALSRGAAWVSFVETDGRSARQLQATVEQLAPGRAQVSCADALAWLRGRPQPFDVVFLDPPFDTDPWAELLPALESGGWLASAAQVYIEHGADRPVPALPGGWQLRRSSRAGAVSYHLATRATPPDAEPQ